MNNMQIFKNEQFGEVRVVEQNGEPWFVGKDVAEILGYSDTNKAVAMHVDNEDKKLNDKSSLSFGQRGAHLINESGLYSLILSSKLPQAKQFKRWVTSEVLPSIRKHGGYINGQESMTDEELLSKALIMAQSKIEEKTREIERMLRQNGVEIGQNRLFVWLRDNGYLIKRKGTDWNMPSQMAMELELFEIKETVITHSDGHTSVNKTVKVTGKGQQYFINKFLGAA